MKTVLGASKEDIIKLVLTQILTISLISYIISIIIGYFSAGILNNYFNIQILSNNMNLMLNIIITIPMSLLCLIIVLINVFKSNLSEEIR
ncbi:FtsX-like permease family protein [Clostridium tetani]|uniref:FtsX-like permease family protein n=1 Tax=Clostridium tetani TaxID=1513 RepID=UPI0037C00927